MTATTEYTASAATLYKKWVNMRYNARYGLFARDTGVCKAWGSAKSFMDWAEKTGYKDGMKLARKDVGKPYSPSNCYWSETRNPPRPKIMIKHRGVTRSIQEWSDATGIPAHTIRRRHKKGLSPKEILAI